MDVSPHTLLSKIRKRLKHVPDFDHIQAISLTERGLASHRLQCDLGCLLDYVAYMTMREERRQRRQPKEQSTRWSKFSKYFTRMNRFGWM